MTHHTSGVLESCRHVARFRRLHAIASGCNKSLLPILLSVLLVIWAGPMVAPVAVEMLKRLEAACLPFRRLIEHWPHFGPALGGTLAAAMQETSSAVIRQCSLIIAPPETPGASIPEDGSTVAR